MARGYKNRNSRDGFTQILPRPVREFFGRFSIIILIIISIISVFAGKSENHTVTYVRAKILDTLTPVMGVIVVPLDAMRDSKASIQTYMFVHGKNEQLDSENKKLRLQVVRLYQVQKENERLKELLNYVQDVEYKYISAKVVGNASGPFARSVLVNAGENDEVLKGQAVIMNGGLVGRIIEVGGHSSRVLLLTDINSKISVISMDSRERSILAGNNTDSPKLIYLPKESKIADGEVLVTSGDGDMLPPGIMVGKAHKLTDGSYEIMPFVSWHNIEYVSVLGLKTEKKQPVE
jgi:rod shape-determining protein MreC